MLIRYNVTHLYFFLNLLNGIIAAKGNLTFYPLTFYPLTFYPLTFYPLDKHCDTNWIAGGKM